MGIAISTLHVRRSAFIQDHRVGPGRSSPRAGGSQRGSVALRKLKCTSRGRRAFGGPIVVFDAASELRFSNN